MEVIKIKCLEKNKEQKNKIKVAAYARVSTDHEDQKNSFSSQKKFYENKIKNHSEWILVDIYADEGLSGTSLTKRTNFIRMINDAMIGNIDIILTKSISRFARNTVDTLKYVRMLKERNIGILFEEENINTLDKTGEFLLTVLSSVAQQESENISAHVRKGHEMLLRSGKVLFGNGCLGYRYINKDLRIEVVPEEAEIVKKIFALFLEGNSIGFIKRYLESNNIKTYRNRSKWDTTNIKNILRNEKYVGDLLQGKICKANPFEKRKKNIGQFNQYLIRDYHEAIISREDFAKTQELIEKKYSEVYGKQIHYINPLSYRIKCGYCGSPTNSARTKNTGTFILCRNRKKFGREVCQESRDIQLEKIFNIIGKSLIKYKEKILKNDNINLSYVKSILKETNKEIDINIYSKLIKFVFVGGYDCYNRAQPFMIRIVLFNNYPITDFVIKKIPDNEAINSDTIKLYEDWFSQKIITYGPPGPNYKRTTISKVKVVIELDNTNCTLV